MSYIQEHYQLPQDQFCYESVFLIAEPQWESSEIAERLASITNRESEQDRTIGINQQHAASNFGNGSSTALFFRLSDFILSVEDHFMSSTRRTNTTEIVRRRTRLFENVIAKLYYDLFVIGRVIEKWGIEMDVDESVTNNSTTIFPLQRQHFYSTPIETRSPRVFYVPDARKTPETVWPPLKFSFPIAELVLFTEQDLNISDSALSENKKDINQWIKSVIQSSLSSHEARDCLLNCDFVGTVRTRERELFSVEEIWERMEQEKPVPERLSSIEPDEELVPNQAEQIPNPAEQVISMGFHNKLNFLREYGFLSLAVQSDIKPIILMTGHAEPGKGPRDDAVVTEQLGFIHYLVGKWQNRDLEIFIEGLRKVFDEKVLASSTSRKKNGREIATSATESLSFRDKNKNFHQSTMRYLEQKASEIRSLTDPNYSWRRSSHPQHPTIPEQDDDPPNHLNNILLVLTHSQQPFLQSIPDPKHDFDTPETIAKRAELEANAQQALIKARDKFSFKDPRSRHSFKNFEAISRNQEILDGQKFVTMGPLYPADQILKLLYPLVKLPNLEEVLEQIEIKAQQERESQESQNENVHPVVAKKHFYPFTVGTHCYLGFRIIAQAAIYNDFTLTASDIWAPIYEAQRKLTDIQENIQRHRMFHYAITVKVEMEYGQYNAALQRKFLGYNHRGLAGPPVNNDPADPNFGRKGSSYYALGPCAKSSVEWMQIEWDVRNQVEAMVMRIFDVEGFATLYLHFTHD